MIKWKLIDGTHLSCIEKIKIMDDNFKELVSLNLPLKELANTIEFKDAMEDCILLGVSTEDLLNHINLEISKKSSSLS